MHEQEDALEACLIKVDQILSAGMREKLKLK